MCMFKDVDFLFSSGMTFKHLTYTLHFFGFRFESLDKDKDNHGDGYKSEFSNGSDLYKDDEDRDRLAAMVELEQEMELAKWGEKQDTRLALRKCQGAQQQTESSRPRARGGH